MASLLVTFLGLALLVATGLLLRRLVYRPGPEIKFGHAFPHPGVPADPIGEAVGVLNGTTPLGPRLPHARSAVLDAERLLGIDPGKRPVYAYVGCLHPQLGRIGFIVMHEWFRREPHGVSRCDTGGLVGRVGGFRYLDESEAHNALSSLSHGPTLPWEELLFTEVRMAFGQFRNYLSGDNPNPASYPDARQKCIDGVLLAREVLDRRLWTWEARSFSPISVDVVYAVALAPEALKELLHRLGRRLPTDIEFLPGHVTAKGTHYFLEDQVVAAFERRSR